MRLLETMTIEEIQNQLLDLGIELGSLHQLSSRKEFSPNVVAILSLDQNGVIAITNLVSGMIVNGVAMTLDDIAVIIDVDLLKSLSMRSMKVP